MAESPELLSKLNASDREVQRYVSALKSEIANLQTRGVRLEAENFSLREQIAALRHHAAFADVIDMTAEQVEEKLAELARGMGYKLVKTG